MKLSLGLALVAAAVTLVAGCTAPSPTPTPTGPGSTQPTRKASPLPSQPNMGPNANGVAKDVTILACPTEPGAAVVAKGNVKNTAKETRDISITVIWLQNDSGNPQGSGIVLLRDLKPGESRNWEVKAETVAKSDRCALHAISGKLTQASSTPKPSPSGSR